MTCSFLMHPNKDGDEEYSKVILAEDTHTHLVDELCDMMLLCGGNNAAFREALDTAMFSAENTHFAVEKSGDSEGIPIYVDAQTEGSEIVTLHEFAPALKEA